ncbi:MAG: hypothetical protein AAF715_07620 [Myxococcota bacterium]
MGDDRKDPVVRKGALALSALALTPDDGLQNFTERRVAKPGVVPEQIKRARELLDAVAFVLVSTRAEDWRRLDQAWEIMRRVARPKEAPDSVLGPAKIPGVAGTTPIAPDPEPPPPPSPASPAPISPAPAEPAPKAPVPAFVSPPEPSPAPTRAPAVVPAAVVATPAPPPAPSPAALAASAPSPVPPAPVMGTASGAGNPDATAVATDEAIAALGPVLPFTPNKNAVPPPTAYPPRPARKSDVDQTMSVVNVALADLGLALPFRPPGGVPTEGEAPVATSPPEIATPLAGSPSPPPAVPSPVPARVPSPAPAPPAGMPAATGSAPDAVVVVPAPSPGASTSAATSSGPTATSDGRTSHLTLEQYASFCVEREWMPDQLGAVLQRYRVAGPDALHALDTYWKARLQNVRVRMRFSEITAGYRDWLRQHGGGAP